MVASTAPGQSVFALTGAGPTGKTRGAAATAMAATTAGSANIHRHGSQVTAAPEATVPAIAPALLSTPHVASALPCRGQGHRDERNRPDQGDLHSAQQDERRACGKAI